MTELYTVGGLLIAWLVACTLCAWKKQVKPGVFDSDGLFKELQRHSMLPLEKQGKAYDPAEDSHKIMLGETESYFE